MCAQRCSQRIFAMELAGGAVTESTIYRFDRSPLCAGTFTFANRLGGRVTAMAYPVGGGEFFMAWFTNFRRDLMLKLLRAAAPEDFGCAAAETPLSLYMVRCGGGVFAAVVNPTPDAAEGFEIEAGFLPGKARRLDAAGKWEEAEFSRRGDRLVFSGTIPPMEVDYLLFE